MMTKEIRKKSPESIEDLYNQNYTIAIEEAKWSWKVLSEMIPEYRTPKIVNLTAENYYNLFKQQIYNDSAKLAVLITENQDCKGVQLKEALFTDSASIAMRRNQFLFWLTEETLQSIIPAGIPQHLIKFYYDINFPIKEVQKSGPKVLKIDDLKYGFVIWIIASLTTLFVFISELMAKFFAIKILNGIKKKIQNVFGGVIVISWLRKYVRKNYF